MHVALLLQGCSIHVVCPIIANYNHNINFAMLLTNQNMLMYFSMER